jgi:hypothetical protein|tara:strand:+ start:190 stop:375 length:186 start_codon:yes stop_codon:yes gene_type:complete
MFVGYESYIAVAICLFCTWLGYTQGKRNGIEKALEGMIQMKLLRVNLNGEIVAGSELKQDR